MDEFVCRSEPAAPSPSLVDEPANRQASALPAPEGDEDGYLTDEWLDALGAADFDFAEAADFLVNVLPAACEQMSCCGVKVNDGASVSGAPVKLVEFWTGGWSGAEELIGVALQKITVKMWQVQWRRGGHYWFEVPARLLTPAGSRHPVTSDGEGERSDADLNQKTGDAA